MVQVVLSVLYKYVLLSCFSIYVNVKSVFKGFNMFYMLYVKTCKHIVRHIDLMNYTFHLTDQNHADWLMIELSLTRIKCI